MRRGFGVALGLRTLLLFREAVKHWCPQSPCKTVSKTWLLLILLIQDLVRELRRLFLRTLQKRKSSSSGPFSCPNLCLGGRRLLGSSGHPARSHSRNSSPATIIISEHCWATASSLCRPHKIPQRKLRSNVLSEPLPWSQKTPLGSNRHPGALREALMLHCVLGALIVCLVCMVPDDTSIACSLLCHAHDS